ncbi:MAG: TatD family hydrolase [Candidatus Moraniibacteriota bacterium]
MIDTHAHIHDEMFDVDREEMLLRAFGGGVKRIITIGTSISESEDALAAAKKYDNIFATVAVHPEKYSKLPDKETRNLWMKCLGKLAMDSKVVAIGECGLDYHAFNTVAVTEEQKESQKIGFRDHLELAKRIGKPVVIHARESYRDVLEIAREYVGDIPFVVLHCYQGDTEVTEEFLNLDERVLFSFAGNITYPVKKSLVGTKGDILESIRLIPIERMLTETDCPYLAPQAYRGTRNEPAYVMEVARKIAEVKKVSFKEVERATEENTNRCFPRKFAS